MSTHTVDMARTLGVSDVAALAVVLALVGSRCATIALQRRAGATLLGTLQRELSMVIDAWRTSPVTHAPASSPSRRSAFAARPPRPTTVPWRIRLASSVTVPLTAVPGAAVVVPTGVIERTVPRDAARLAVAVRDAGGSGELLHDAVSVAATTAAVHLAVVACDAVAAAACLTAAQQQGPWSLRWCLITQRSCWPPPIAAALSRCEETCDEWASAASAGRHVMLPLNALRDLATTLGRARRLLLLAEKLRPLARSAGVALPQPLDADRCGALQRLCSTWTAAMQGKAKHGALALFAAATPPLLASGGFVLRCAARCRPGLGSHPSSRRLTSRAREVLFGTVQRQGRLDVWDLGPLAAEVLLGGALDTASHLVLMRARNEASARALALQVVRVATADWGDIANGGRVTQLLAEARQSSQDAGAVVFDASGLLETALERVLALRSVWAFPQHTGCGVAAALLRSAVNDGARTQLELLGRSVALCALLRWSPAWAPWAAEALELSQAAKNPDEAPLLTSPGNWAVRPLQPVVPTIGTALLLAVAADGRTPSPLAAVAATARWPVSGPAAAATKPGLSLSEDAGCDVSVATRFVAAVAASEGHSDSALERVALRPAEMRRPRIALALRMHALDVSSAVAAVQQQHVVSRHKASVVRTLSDVAASVVVRPLSERAHAPSGFRRAVAHDVKRLSAVVAGATEERDERLYAADTSAIPLLTHGIDRAGLAAPSAGPLSEGAPCSITFEGVTFAYPSDPGRLVLDDVSFAVPAGAFAGIVGASGSGKSTLLSLLLRLHEPMRGRILVGGVDVRDIPPRWLRRRLGVVGQGAPLLDGTVEANLRVGRLDAGADALGAALGAAAADFVAAKPRGLQTRVGGGRGAGGLSGGEAQRVAVARALMRGASTPASAATCGAAAYVFDEATSALDVETERRVQRAMAATGATTIAVAHRLFTLRDAGVVVVLDHGRVVEQGSFAALAADPTSQLARLVALQAVGAEGLGEREESAGPAPELRSPVLVTAGEAQAAADPAARLAAAVRRVQELGARRDGHGPARDALVRVAASAAALHSSSPPSGGVPPAPHEAPMLAF